MTTFDSTKASLNDLLREIKEGKVQLPDFQRGWVWDDEHIQALLVSVGRSFPIGAVMLLEAGGDVRFETRPVEGLEDVVGKDRPPEKLILDGQQRLTALTQALTLEERFRHRPPKTSGSSAITTSTSGRLWRTRERWKRLCWRSMKGVRCAPTSAATWSSTCPRWNWSASSSASPATGS